MEAKDRLIVAADFDPKEEGGFVGVMHKVLILGEMLSETGVIIKVNSVLRACGYNLIPALRESGIRVCADLKLIDITNTMKTDAPMIKEFEPDFLTVMCCAGIDGMRVVQEEVGMGTEVLGVTVLTSLDEEECQGVFGCSTKAGVLRFARMAELAQLGGLVLSPQEAEMLAKKKELRSLTRNTPGIRPVWSLVPGDDQKRIMTPGKAIEAGADRIIVGRPITQAENPRDAVKRTLEEIEVALSRKGDAK